MDERQQKSVLLGFTSKSGYKQPSEA